MVPSTPLPKNLSYEQGLRKLKLTTLKAKRKRGDLIQTFKLLNHIDDIHYQQIFELDHLLICTLIYEVTPTDSSLKDQE
jgi:hypothetical protein